MVQIVNKTGWALGVGLLLLMLACTGKDNPVGTKAVDGNYSISSIFPNPSDTTTTITITLFSDEYVNLYIQNPMGDHLYTFVQDSVAAGSHDYEWNFSTQNGKNLRNGLYFVTLEIPSLNILQSRVIERR